MKGIIYTFFVFMFLFGTSILKAQNIGINSTGATPDASAMLDVASTNKGFLAPRVALTATNAASPITSPAASLLVYNTATAGTSPNNVVPGYYYWSGSAWIPFVVGASIGSSAWGLTGNAATNPATNFLGTTDNIQLILKSNNAPYVEMGTRQTLGLVQAFADYTDGTEKVTYVRSAIQFEAASAQFYKPKMWTDANGNFRMKGSSAGTDYFEFGATGTTANAGGFDFIIGDDGDEPILFKSYNFSTGITSEIMRLQSGRMAIGSSSFDGTSPEKLLVDAGTTTSYNLMTGRGSINNYLQINVKNNSTGTSASSDLVATADNGSESNNFVDLGINGSGYTGGVMGVANDAYLYNLGQNLLIGAGSSGKALIFLTGGTTQASNQRMRIDGNGLVSINNRLHVGSTVDPTSTLQVTGSVAKSITTQTGNTYAATATDHTIICSPALGNMIVSLPAAAGVTGRIYVIKRNSGLFLVSVDPSGSETIDGGSANRALANNESIMIQSNGTSWFIISRMN